MENNEFNKFDKNLVIELDSNLIESNYLKLKWLLLYPSKFYLLYLMSHILIYSNEINMVEELLQHQK
jgi:hypothetical protein